ncbi:hypothetical protein LCGC14_2280320, partial [marine sediment metagenome]
VSLMPGMTRAQRKLANVFFAPRFLMAMTGVFKDLLRPGAAGFEARRTLGMVFGGGMAALIAGNLASEGKLPNLTDPDKVGFLGIRVGDAHVYPFGPFQPYIVAAFRTSRASLAVARGETPSSRDAEAWPRFVEGKLNVGARWMVRVSEAMGLPVSSLRGEPFRGPAVGEGGMAAKKGLLEEVYSVMPIGGIQAARGMIEEGEPATALEIAGGRTTVMSPYRRLEDAWEREYRRAFNPEVDFAVAEQNPRLAPLVEEIRRSGLERGRPGAERAETLQKTRVELETRLDLPSLAEGALKGDAEAGSAFARAWDDYTTQMVGAYANEYLKVESKRESEEGKRLQAYREIDKNDYPDPDNPYETDWDAFTAAKDRAFAKLSPELQRAIEADIKSQDPNVQRVERRIKEAKRLKRELYDTIDPYVNLTRERVEEIGDFVADVNKQRREWRETRGVDVPLRDAMKFWGKRTGKSEAFVAVAILLQSNKVRYQALNPEYDQFLIEHRDELEFFFPDLYRRKALQLAIYEGAGSR